MDLKDVREHWNALGKKDAMWAILTDPKKAGRKWKTDEFFASGVAEIEDILRYVDGLELHPPRGRALDFGCGIGRLTQALAANFEETWGVDIAKSMIDLANQHNRHGERCRYHWNTAGDLRFFEDRFFDFIYTRLVLQHMEPKYSKAYIAEFLRVLRPGGVLIFQLPSTGPKATPLRGVNRLRVPLRGALNGMSIAVRGRPLFGVIEMYSVPRAEVLAIVEEGGGTVVDVQPDMQDEWIGHRYCVTR
jgi:SAM-dependent methyltransferase